MPASRKKAASAKPAARKAPKKAARGASKKARAAAKPGGGAADGRAAVEAWLEAVQPELRPVAKRLDAVVRKGIAGVRYAIKWRAPFYGLPGQGWLVSMMAFKGHVDLNFFRGVDLQPPPPDGASQLMRHVKVRTPAEAGDPQIRSWVEQAQRLPGWGRV